MAIISLGAINKKILFAVFAGVFKLFANIILHHSTVKMNSHPCILGINAGFGLSLSFFPFLYLKLKNRKIATKDNLKIMPTVNDDIMIYNDEEEKKKKGKNFYILIIAILDCGQKFSTFFFLKHFLENFWIFDSFLLLLFSFLIIKTKVYAHHFLSIIMIVIIGIILNVINYYGKEINFFQVFITLLTEIFYCLENVICKFVMETKFSPPYEVCFKVGFFELLVFIILLITFSNVPIKAIDKVNKFSNEYIDDFYEYIHAVDLTEILLFILLLFLRCIFILFGFVITDYYSPNHIVLILIIGEISFLFLDDYNWKLYVKIIFFIFLIFFILVFVEILELNIFGLQNNTKKNITKRSEIEDFEDNQRDSDANIDIKDGSKSDNLIEMNSQRTSLNNENDNES